MPPAADLAAVDPAPVLIALCTYNGARWLPAQLASIAAQDHRDWSLWVSDDGSSDATRDLISAFAAEHPDHEVHLVEGPRAGGRGAAAQNFLHLINLDTLPIGPRTHVALCDQDDIWLPNRLGRALSLLAAQPDAGQALIYGGQTRHIDADGRLVGRSRRPRRAVVVENAFVQNMVSGHTLMLNPAALALARAAGRPAGVTFHDWWLSLLVLACGGRAVVDATEVVLYRQHDSNVLGAPQGSAAGWRRLWLMWRGDYARWFAANLAGLSRNDLPLTAKARQVVDGLASAKGAMRRSLCLWRAGAHRQGKPGTFMLYLACLLGRI